MDTQNSSTSAAMEKDPVCGMNVDPARAKATFEHAGKTYYFCCAGCREKFSAAPAKYLAPKTLIGISPAPAKPIQIAPAAAHGAGTPAAPSSPGPSAASKPAPNNNEY